MLLTKGTYMLKHLMIILMIVFVGTNKGSAQGKLPNDNNHLLGTNLTAVVDWTAQQPFVDVFKTSRPWISQRQGAAWGEGGDLALTPEGWIAALTADQYAETLMFTDDPDYPEGDYTVLYDGEGTITFGVGNVSVASSERGRIVAKVSRAAGGISLQVRATNPDNPIRNIRFIMPGYEKTYQNEPFNPNFLKRIERFAALRFMDWMLTNDSTAVTPADLPKVTDATYMLRGVPVEIMVQLANTLHADPWFNMPHRASDDYVRAFASVVHEKLSADLKAYIEYSNETWNSQFSQAQYVIEQGTVLGLGDGDTFLSGLRYHSMRAVEIFKIWERVFGDNKQLVRVLAAQSGNAWTGEQIATWQDAFKQADVLAIAPYFSCDDPGNPQTADKVAKLTVEQLLDRQMANVKPGGCAVQQVTENAAVAKTYKLKLIAYEGGQHLAGYGGAENNEQLTGLFIAANRHPRMKDIYQQYLTMWNKAGGDLFMHFTDVTRFSKFGSWGSLEYLTQPVNEAPKYQALMRYIDDIVTH
jgi:hypothetical protein